MDQQYDIATVEQLSDAQEKALAILPLPSAVLSIIGSSVIIYVAINSRTEQKWTPYTRLLIMMSATDILFSSTIGIGGFLRPNETSTRAWAFGSAATCSAIGFLNQIAISSVLYNAMLSCYFLLTARFGFRNSFIARNVEPWMHFVSIGYPLLTATVGAAAGEYGEMTVNGLVCWLVKFPTNCGYGKGESGEECLSQFIGWLFYGLPVLITFASIIANSVILVLFVQKQALPSSSNSNSNSNKRAGQPERDQSKRLRLVRTQAVLFLASFTVCIFWTCILNSVESTAATKEEDLALMYRWFPISVIQAVFMPLQGFLNMFVYLRPKYLKARKEYPSESKFWAFRRSVFGDDIKPTRNTPSHPIQDAKVELVTKKKRSARQKNALVGAFDSNEVEFYDDDDVVAFNGAATSKKLYSKKVSKQTLSSYTASQGDFGHVMDDQQDDTDRKENYLPSLLIQREFQSSLPEWSSLEVISEEAETVFEPISTPPLHSLPAPPPPPPLNLQNMEGRWSADSKNSDGNSQSTSAAPPQADSPKKARRSKNLDSSGRTEETQCSDDEDEGVSKDTPIRTPARQNSDDSLSSSGSSSESSSESSDGNDGHTIREPARQLSDESISQGDDSDSQPIEPLDNPLQPLASPLQALVSNDVPIRAPARHLSDDSLTGADSSSSSDEQPAGEPVEPAETDTAPTVDNPVASSSPTVDRQAVEIPVILPSQRPARSRMHGSAFFYSAGRH